MEHSIMMRRSYILLFLSVNLGQSAFPQIQTVEDRITAILNQMTTAEKIKQLHPEGGFNTADNTRLKIPGFIMSDGPHGVRDGYATSFPVGIGMAAMWDVDMAYRIGVAMGKEFRGKGKHQALGPALDLDRDPRNGRSAETGGEDPYLDAQTTTAVTKGIQSTPTIATLKHYNANHRENGRTTNNIIASMRSLTEINGLTFRTAVQEGGAMSVMNAYNLINGDKCAENSTILTSILRNYWGFPFYVVSDWGSIWDPGKAITAGCDLEMGSNLYEVNLPTLVASGTVTQAVLDQAVRRVLRTKLLSGMLDYQPEGDPADVNSAAHQQLCLEAARKSIVLLKNQDNILPLSKSSVSKIALIGPSAAIAQLDGGGSAYVTPYYAVSPKQGIETKIGSAKIVYTKGCDINSFDTTGFPAARAAASSADVVVFVGGLDPSQEGEGMDRAGGLINLPPTQQELINVLAQSNKNVIVVIYSGGICGVYNSIANTKALLYAFYPGQEAGNALADILFGDINPSGKLPVTMPRLSGFLPPWNDRLDDGLGGGYRWFDVQGYGVEFAFGQGLSYSTFNYSNLVITPQSASYGVPVTVSVDVKNTGTWDGEEVVQLYITHTNSSIPRAVKELKGFKRAVLAAGESKTVTFTITNDELYNFSEASNSYEVEAGTKTIQIGTASDHLLLTGTFAVLDGDKKPDLRITNIKMVPPYPLKGQKVTFAAMVKNQGTGPTTAGIPVKTSFKVNGKVAAWSANYTQPIPAGGMAFIQADEGPSGTNLWNADSLAIFTVSATVDLENTINECDETNNSQVAALTVFPQPAQNIALNKTVVVSSIEKTGLEGPNAVDGNFSTRWASAFTDPQYIIVDLGSVQNLSEILLYWEAAYGKSYLVQLSDDGINYKTIFTENNGDGGIDKITTTEKGRYIKILGLQRGTPYGYSLYEIVVHALQSSDVKTALTSLPQKSSLGINFPNPFNPATTIKYDISVTSDVRLTVFDLLGRAVLILVNEKKVPGSYQVRFDGGNLPTGVYIYKLEAGKYTAARKLVLMK